MDETEQAIDVYVAENKFLAYRELPDGRALTLTQEIFTVLLTIGMARDCGYSDGWMYEDPIAAVLAYATWEPQPGPTGPGNEPSGWVRHNTTYRRRPGGDASREYVPE